MSNFRGTDLCKSLKSHKRSDSKEIWQQRDLTAKRSHSKGIPQKRDLTAKRSHSKESRRKEIWQQRDLTAKISVLERSLARKLWFHIFISHFLREVSHESFIFTSSTLTFEGKSRRKASFSHLQLSDLEGSLARKLRFHDVSHEMRFWKLANARNAVLCNTKSATVAVCSCRFRRRFANFKLIVFEGCLAQKLCFHSFNFHFLRDASHESFAFTSSTFRFGGSLARKLRFHIFNFQIWRGVSHESLQFSLFVGSLTRNLCFYMFNLHLHESFVFTRFVGAAAAWVILWSFAAGHRGSYWSGCIQVAIVICQKFFSIFALVIFLFEKCFKIYNHFFALAPRYPVLELQFLALLRVVASCFATQSLQIALEWLRMRPWYYGLLQLGIVDRIGVAASRLRWWFVSGLSLFGAVMFLLKFLLKVLQNHPFYFASVLILVPLCVKACVCKSSSVQKLLCVKACCV